MVARRHSNVPRVTNRAASASPSAPASNLSAVFVDRLSGAARGVWNLGYETYEQWRDHRTIRLGAGLAYYGLFASVPMLAVALAVAGLVISRGDIQSYLADQLSGLLGIDADPLAAALADALDSGATVAGLGLVGAVSLMLTASLLVIALQDAFNTIWERPVRAGLRQTLLRRLTAFAVVAGAGAVIVVSFAVNAVTALLERLSPDIAILVSLQELIGFVTSWALAIGVMALLLRSLVDAHVPWRAALVGGAVTSAILAVGSVLTGAYLRRYAASSLTGVTGSVFLVLLWAYYVAQFVLVGAEFTRVLTRRQSSATGRAEGEVTPS